MLKHLVLAALVISMATPALASKARLRALGQDPNGSPYLDDTRSIFLNPAFMMKMGNFVNFEMGGSTINTTGGGGTAQSNPNAEGGFIYSVSGDNKIGVQLGRQTMAYDQISETNTQVTTGSNLLSAPENNFEVLFGGGGSSKWGIGVTYGNSEEKATVTPPATTNYPNMKANTLELRGGLADDKWHAYGKLLLMSRSEREQAAGQVARYEGRPSIQVGGAYNLTGDQKLYASATFAGYTGRTRTATTDREASDTRFNVGWVQFVNPDAATRFFYTAGLAYSAFNYKNDAGQNEYKQDRMYVPVVIGLENQASDWLALRASVTQNVILDQTKTTVTNTNSPNSTVVAAGTGIRWKKLLFDATLAAGTNGQVNATNFMTNAGLTYAF